MSARPPTGPRVPAPGAGNDAPLPPGARWAARTWKLAFFVALLGATYVLLMPAPPAVGPEFAGGDKLKHLVLFAALGVFASHVYADKPRWGIVAALAFFGLCTEIGQSRTGRDFDLLDALADAVGSLAALVRFPRFGR